MSAAGPVHAAAGNAAGQAPGAAPAGLGSFLIVWLGQLVSYAGSGLTSFALAVWAYETTGSITQMTLLSAFSVLPAVVLSPLAGTYVDRWDRRRTMLGADAASGAATLVVALLLLAGDLRVWHAYVAVCAVAVCGSLRWPALSASTSQLVPAEHYGRASGLLQVIQAGQAMLSPVLAGVLMPRIHLQGILLIDVTTFALGFASLLAVKIPRPAASAEAQAERGSIARETRYGWTYIVSRPELRALLAFGFVASAFIDMASLVLVPLVLGMASAAVLGTTISVGGVGFLVGGALMSAWGGPARPIQGVVGFPMLAGVFVAAIGFQSGVPAITACLFGVFACLPLFYACNQTLWLLTVAADVQGRVFALRRTLIMGARLLASVLVGPLAERVFEPLMLPGGLLAARLGPLLGTGPGAGLRLLFLALGAALIFVSASSLAWPALRRLDDVRPERAASA